MDRVFSATRFVTVPDGTEVSAFLNATDLTQDVPWGILGDVSIAAGGIRPHSQSWVHVHPVISVVTYVVHGRLTVRMRDAGCKDHYDLRLASGQAVLASPGTYVQLRNENEVTTEVLYIATPSYVFEVEGDRVLYDDAILIAKTWDEAAQTHHASGAVEMTQDHVKRLRRESIRRLAKKKAQHG